MVVNLFGTRYIYGKGMFTGLHSNLRALLMVGRSLNTTVVNRWDPIVLKPGGHKEMSSILADQ